MHKVAKMVG